MADTTGATYGMQNQAPQQGAGTDEIDLTLMDKMRRMVSTDEEWEAILLKKMEEKRNREAGIPEPPKQPFNLAGTVGATVGGFFEKAKSAIPVNIPNMPNLPIKIPGMGGAAGANNAFAQPAPNQDLNNDYRAVGDDSMVPQQ